MPSRLQPGSPAFSESLRKLLEFEYSKFQTLFTEGIELSLSHNDYAHPSGFCFMQEADFHVHRLLWQTASRPSAIKQFHLVNLNGACFSSLNEVRAWTLPLVDAQLLGLLSKSWCDGCSTSSDTLSLSSSPEFVRPDFQTARHSRHTISWSQNQQEIDSIFACKCDWSKDAKLSSGDSRIKRDNTGLLFISFNPFILFLVSGLSSLSSIEFKPTIVLQFIGTMWVTTMGYAIITLVCIMVPIIIHHVSVHVTSTCGIEWNRVAIFCQCLGYPCYSRPWKFR